MKSKKTVSIEATDAKVMADLITDSQTSDYLKVTIINKLLEENKESNFFKTIFDEKMSFGECPKCGLKLHWLIPENSLNKMGWVTAEEDSRVKEYTNKKICPRWQEACSKKKISV